MQSGYLPFHQSTIHYLKSGKGNKALICFHGFGESASNFNFLTARLESEFTLIAIDLPFHGETEWKADSLDGNDLKNIITDILVRENLPGNNIYLMGFSLGGRIALSVLELMPAEVSRLVLLAPDGLKINFWYWLSTQTLAGNKCFQWTMKSPGWFLGMLRIGNRLHLINRSVYKFVEYYIHDAGVRKELYDRWTSMRKCKPNLHNIRKQAGEYALCIRLLYGKHDRIISTSPANRFIDGLAHTKIEVLDCGHQVLHSKNAEYIVEALFN